jgi:hypothetical protein
LIRLNEAIPKSFSKLLAGLPGSFISSNELDKRAALRTPPSSNGLGLVFGNRGLPSSSGYRVLLVAIAYVGRQVAVVVPGVGGNT